MPQDIAYEMNPDETAQPEKAARLTLDFSRVLIVGRSQINKVVVGRSVERSGLRPHAEGPESAAGVLRQSVPGTVILDGGPDDRDCDSVVESIVALRRATGSNAPRVIFLSNKIGDAKSLSLSHAVDAVVTKPITAERLQPILEQLVTRLRR